MQHAEQCSDYLSQANVTSVCSIIYHHNKDAGLQFTQCTLDRMRMFCKIKTEYTMPSKMVKIRQWPALTQLYEVFMPST